MPAIHVIYDRNDNVSVPPPEVMKRMGVNIVVLRVEAEIELDKVDTLAKAAATMLLNQIAEDDG